MAPQKFARLIGGEVSRFGEVLHFEVLALCHTATLGGAFGFFVGHPRVSCSLPTERRDMRSVPYGYSVRQRSGCPCSPRRLFQLSSIASLVVPSKPGLSACPDVGHLNQPPGY